MSKDLPMPLIVLCRNQQLNIHQSNPSVIQIERLLINDEILYRITDNELGIDAKLIPVIFGLFQRLDNAEDIEGSGVGLAIVKRIMEKHNGKVWFESKLDKGTTFYLSFECPD